MNDRNGDLLEGIKNALYAEAFVVLVIFFCLALLVN